ncbi:hypothetical protein [Clostridium ganghwense]|uniref:hypothetical protein n=1 Tax=Clostridium ganghwense TaxID=312089 RepID=UPI003AF01565
MFVMIFYYIVVRMPLAKLLSISKWGLNGIWIAVLISHIAAAIAGFCYFKVLLKKDNFKCDIESTAKC